MQWYEPSRISPSGVALGLLSGQALFLGFSSSAFYAVANTLFVMAYGSAYLPQVYLTAAVVGFLFSVALVQVQRRWAIPGYCIILMAFFAITFFLSRFGLTILHLRWLPLGLKVTYALLLQFSALIPSVQAGQIFRVQQMKRLYPIVVGSHIIGVISGGLLVGPLENWLGGTQNLLFVAAGSMSVALVFVLLVVVRFRDALWCRLNAPRAASRSRQLSLVHLIKRPHSVQILLFLFLFSMGGKLVDYIYISQVSTRFASEPELTRFFGNVMAVCTLLTLLFLVFLTGRLLMRFGVGIGLIANPVTVGVLSIAAALVGLLGGPQTSAFFWVVFAMQFFDSLTANALAEPAIKTTYQPLPLEHRARLQTIAEGIGTPLAAAITGGCLLAFEAVPGLDSVAVLSFSAGIMILFVLVSLLLYRTYNEVLARSLSRSTISPRRFSLADKSSLTVVDSMLDSPKAQEVRVALDALEQAEHPSLEGRLVALTGHPAAAVREDVYGRIERLQVRAALSAVSARMSAEKPARVRAMALRAFCALADDSLEAVAPHLAETDAEIRLAGMTGLLRYGGISGALLLGERLNALLQSSEPADRLFVARLVGEVGSPTFYQPLLTLLTDTLPDIRNVALASAGQVAHPRLLPLVVGNLAHIPCRSTALAALVSFGPALISTVDAVLHGLSDHSEDTVLRLLRVCGQIRGEAVIATLKEHRDQVEKDRRYEILRSLFLCGYQAAGEERAAVKEQVLGEVRHGVRVLLAREEMDQGSELGGLRSALDDDVAATLRRIFFLLSFLYDARRIKSAEERLVAGDAQQRSLALELLDNTLRGEVRAVVAALVREKLSPGKHLERLRRRFSLERMDAESRIREIIARPEMWPDSWIRTCAVYAAGRLNRQELASAIAESGSRAWPPEPAVASWALCTLDPQSYASYALGSVSDVAEVGGKAQQWGRGEWGEGDGSMLLNIEKVVLLKSVGVFAHTADSALASVASIVEPVEVTAGEPIIEKGDMESCLYLIVRGRVRVHDGDRDIAHLGQGEVIGEMAMLDPAPRSASVTAVEDGLLFRIEKEAFDAVMADNPEVVQGVIHVLCQRLRKMIGAPE